MQQVKKFKGYSGCWVSLIKKNKKQFVVLKQGSDQLASSAQILAKLAQLGFNVPKTQIVCQDKIFIEYINGLSMREYIRRADRDMLDKFIDFLSHYILTMQNHSKPSNIKSKIIDKLNEIDKKSNLMRLNFK
ncbi:MAG: hypothetical protein AAF403_08545, partial [Pseudomonadota bacterium]